MQRLRAEMEKLPQNIFVTGFVSRPVNDGLVA